jgi:molecular chaperone Hsp33
MNKKNIDINLKLNLDLNDHLLKIGFQDTQARLILVRLHESWVHVQKLQEKVENEDACLLLGEALAASCLLASNIKLDGSISFQIRSKKHPLELLVAESNHEFGVRGVLKLREMINFLDMTGLASDEEAHLLVNILPKQQHLKPYQGVVPLYIDEAGFSLQTAIANYMQNSEQIDTHIWLAADKKNAVGMLLQRMPNEGGRNNIMNLDEEDDKWLTLKYLAATLTKKEMLSLSLNEILVRLFHDYIERDAMKLYEEKKPYFYCTCSLERAQNALKLALAKTSVNELMNGDATLDICCDFCGNKYIFNKEDCERLC